ncbi:hypothetical protein BDW75DRAFT_153688 [Aspergillus navahoensis]
MLPKPCNLLSLRLGTGVEGLVDDECKHCSRSIVRAKRATTLGIGSTECRICASALLGRHNVRRVSHFQPRYDCWFSLPLVLGRKGVVQILPVPLPAVEAGSAVGEGIAKHS